MSDRLEITRQQFENCFCIPWGRGTPCNNCNLALDYASQEAEKLRVALLRIEELATDRAFYRCCALSGEVPKDGAEPSAGNR